MIVVIDTETSGLAHAATPPREDGIVQVGIAWRVDGEIRTWESICNPGERFLADGRAREALAVNHLTEDQIRAAKPVEEVSRELKAILLEVYRNTAMGLGTMTSYNVQFDRPFLDAEPWCLGTWLEVPLEIPPRVTWGKCLMQEAMEVIRRRTSRGRLPLSMACEAMGIQVGREAHTAAYDAKLALMLHEKIEKRRSEATDL